ncbi:MAG: DUF3108 domain-containing protein [Pyrinomonadaceae bacterium]
MNPKRLIFTFFLIFGLLCGLSFGQSPPKNLNLYKNGEKLTYEGSFSKLLLRGIDIADLSFTVYNSPDKEDLFIKAEAKSKGTLLKLFSFSFYQKVESTIDADSFNILKTVKRDEQGDRVRDSEAVFDYDSEKVTYVETNPKDPQRPPRRVASTINNETQDLISGLYALRRLPFAVGKTFTLSVSDSGMVYQVPVRVTGREKQKTVLGKVMCWRIEPDIFGENRMIEQKGEMTIWITDDNRRLPVRSKIETKLGKVEIKLRKVERAK